MRAYATYIRRVTNRLSQTFVGIAAIVLVCVAPASARSSYSITISPQDPVVAVIGGDASGVYQLGIVLSARFSPEVLHDSVRVTFTSRKPKGVGAAPFTGYDQGNSLHSTAVYQTPWAAYDGDLIVVAAKWEAYTPEVGGTVKATKTVFKSVQIPKREPAPRLNSVEKPSTGRWSERMAVTCGIFATGGLILLAVPGGQPMALAMLAVAGLGCGASLAFQNMALDPVDLTFRSVAAPETPPAPKVSAGGGLSASAANALNALFAAQAKEIGLARAIVTAFNRSQGAHVKKSSSWERKQVLAAGRYATQLRALMLREPKLRQSAAHFIDVDPVSEGDAYAFADRLVLDGKLLPSQVNAVLAKLGFSKAEQADIRARVAVTAPALYTGDPASLLAGSQTSAALREAAAALKSFSARVGRDPLAIP
jgi:hypothetical protein